MNCTFIDNYATYLGGAIYSEFQDLVVLSYTNFSFNDASLGSLYILAASETRLDCLESGYTMTGFPAYQEGSHEVEKDGVLTYLDESLVIDMEEFYCTANR